MNKFGGAKEMGIFLKNTKAKLKYSLPKLNNMKPSFLVQVLIITAAIVILMLTAAFYMANVNKFLADDMKMYLGEVSKKNVETLKKQIQGDLNTLKSISLSVNISNTINKDITSSLLKKQTELNSFKRMAITLPNGDLYSSDGKPTSIITPTCIAATLKGESSICGPIKDATDNKNVLLYTTPILKDNKPVAVLSASYDIDSFINNLDMSNFDEDAFFIIVNDSGDIILDSANPNFKNIGANIFDEKIYDHSNHKEYLQIKESESLVTSDESGFITLNNLKDERILNYYPLGINNWHLLTIIRTNSINSKNHHIVQTTLALCLSIIVVITCLIILIRHLQVRNKRELEVIYYLDTITRGRNFNRFTKDARNILNIHSSKSYSMVTLDIDKFKYVNDVFGFDKGNEILALIYKILNRNLKNGEVCCRVSHDIFTLLILYKDDESLIKRLKDINETICSNIQKIINHRVLINYGIHVIEDNSADVKLLSDMSHMALKKAKGKFRTCFAFYDNSILESLQEQVEIESSMESSLKDNQFKVYLQPKYSLQTNEIVGAEALIRWAHPTKGLIPPDKFIPLFERNGFISDLDRYVFEKVCITLRNWLDNGYNPLPLSVNLSRVHIHNSKFITDYLSIMEEYSISPSLIEIEFTESVAVYSVDILLDTMNKLKDIGFVIAMDDFGSGYSSLNILKDMPVDVLKLDREFLSDNFNTKRGQTILESIVSMAKKLNMKIVSEGIETSAQAKYMSDIGCDLAQGYYFSKPITINDFEKITYK
ncbi:MAG: GGDEF domain-containing protein [Clostridium sp.]